MNGNIWLKLFVLISFFCSYIVHADEDAELEQKFIPTHSSQAHWTFSGLVTNEQGEQFGYFFEISRQDKEVHSAAALFDAQTKHVLLFEEGSAHTETLLIQNLQMGNNFISFNPINNNWIFGVRTKEKKGFNFKVDMLTTPEKKPYIQRLRSGVELLITQANRLNGHINLEGGETKHDQFVTAKNAWFRQLSFTSKLTQNTFFSGLLCQFNDDSGFYSVNMLAQDAERGAIAGFRNAQGLPSSMSQFVDITQGNEGLWHIKTTSPHLDLTFANELTNPTLVAGFVSGGVYPGFCVISKNLLGSA